MRRKRRPRQQLPPDSPTLRSSAWREALLETPAEPLDNQFLDLLSQVLVVWSLSLKTRQGTVGQGESEIDFNDSASQIGARVGPLALPLGLLQADFRRSN